MKSSKLIKRHRLQSGVTQKEIAKHLKLSNGQYISNVERGKCLIAIKQTNKICSILGINKLEMKLALRHDMINVIEKRLGL